jgi:hypothetical protein
MTAMFTHSGPYEDDLRKVTLPGFIEVEPGRYKPLGNCSRDEIQAKILSLMAQAHWLLGEAKALDRYLEGI